jgi:hypothetical protein
MRRRRPPGAGAGSDPTLDATIERVVDSLVATEPGRAVTAATPVVLRYWDGPVVPECNR